MESNVRQTFGKAERIKSKKLIDQLFQGGSDSFVAYPFRVVYMTVERGKAPASILISVPKRRFHNAVDRNHVKRQVREAYRRQKTIVWEAVEGKQCSLAIAFISIASEQCPSAVVFKSVNKALNKIAKAVAQA